MVSILRRINPDANFFVFQSGFDQTLQFQALSEPSDSDLRELEGQTSSQAVNAAYFKLLWRWSFSDDSAHQRLRHAYDETLCNG